MGKGHLLSGLDEAYELASAGWVREGMDHLSGALWNLRRRSSPDEWLRLCARDLLEHPMREVAHQCPITLRSYEKPRGYAGDAVILDYIYGINSELYSNVSTMENNAFASRFVAPAARAVRFRRELMADLVLNARREEPKGKVLSIACGHLREAALVSNAVTNADEPWWTAFDQDEESLGVVDVSYKHLGVSIRRGNLREILAGKMSWRDFHLVYAAGIFDYLVDKAAVGLIRRMFEATSEGGTLMFANFAPDIPDAGYMESYMAWNLIYRTPGQVEQLVVDAVGSKPNSLDVFLDPDRNIVFAKFRK